MISVSIIDSWLMTRLAPEDTGRLRGLAKERSVARRAKYAQTAREHAIADRSSQTRREQDEATTRR